VVSGGRTIGTLPESEGFEPCSMAVGADRLPAGTVTEVVFLAARSIPSFMADF
jgi:hypothetical protein